MLGGRSGRVQPATGEVHGGENGICYREHYGPDNKLGLCAGATSRSVIGVCEDYEAAARNHELNVH